MKSRSSFDFLDVATFVVSVALSAMLGIGVPALTTMLFQSRGIPIVEWALTAAAPAQHALETPRGDARG